MLNGKRTSRLEEEITMAKKKETTYLAYFCWANDMKCKKSMAVWKICKRSFKCDVAGSSSFIRLEMAQEWMKTLPYLILQFNCIQKVLIRSSSLWRALTFKRFELQIWDWSWMKENSKIFKNTLKKKVHKDFFSLFFYELTKRNSFFIVAFWVLTIYSLSFCQF